MHERMPRKSAKRPPVLSDWDDLRLFLEVARVGSFTAAGATLGVDQATVSRRMAGLEAKLAGALFERTPQGSTLTVLGEKVLRHAQAMEAELHAVVDEASGHEREIEGVVRVALTESIAVHAVIPRVLPQLHRAYPKLTVRLSASYDVEELGHRQAELALRFFRPESGDLVAQRIVRMKTALIGHRRFEGVPRAELPVVGAELGERPSLESRYLERHLRRPPRLFVSSYVSQIEAVRAGIGVALLAKSVLALDPQLVELEPDLPAPPELELWLVTPRSLRHVPRIATVWAALEKGLAFLED
jgi:DNA-binding transcriptional LysR family regulator